MLFVGKAVSILLAFVADRRDFRFAVFGEEIVEGLRDQVLHRLVLLDAENLELIAHLLREVRGDRLGPLPAGLPVGLCALGP